MTTLSNADAVLKDFYLDVIANQLNTNVSPLWNAIKTSTENVEGKKLCKVVPFGLNGGVGAGTEEGTLPLAAENKYLSFELPLVNLYGVLEISDKAVKASAQSSGAFLDLVNAEMEGLLNAGKFSLSRMLFGDGSGVLAVKTAGTNGSFTMDVDSTRNLVEGMTLEFWAGTAKDATTSGARIAKVDHAAKRITLTKALSASIGLSNDVRLYVQGSKDKELCGLGAIVDSTITSLYGIDRTNNAGLNAYVQTKQSSEVFDDVYLMRALDEAAERSGGDINYITCAYDVRRAYQKYLKTNSRNIDVATLAGGYKTITFNGIPIAADRFMKNGEMFMLNTNDFTLCQLGDWDWMTGEAGKILKQKQGFPMYTATLVKYANLICDRPNGVALLKNLC
ncbi:MAG: phage major capsid protein [Firmicutes bacterium]|nr:phage major capsid protein [Bacillota bacterium]